MPLCNFLRFSGNKLANLTMYDVKQLYTAAKNYALNISEIEAKVNEATSDDPWCVSYWPWFIKKGPKENISTD